MSRTALLMSLALLLQAGCGCFRARHALSSAEVPVGSVPTMEQLSGSRFRRRPRMGQRWGLPYVTLHFSGDTFGAHTHPHPHRIAGCTALRGRYSIDEGRFIVRSARVIRGAECSSKEYDDDLLLKFLRSRPWVTVHEQWLTLRCRHGSLRLRTPRESEA